MGNVEFGFDERAVVCKREDCRVKKVYSINKSESGRSCANTVVLYVVDA